MARFLRWKAVPLQWENCETPAKGGSGEAHKKNVPPFGVTRFVVYNCLWLLSHKQFVNVIEAEKTHKAEPWIDINIITLGKENHIFNLGLLDLNQILDS